MDSSLSLVLMALEVINYMRDKVEPHLSLDERLAYLEEYKPRIKFTLTTLIPSNHFLVKTPRLDTATALDAIVTQAIFGREIMMKREWFRVMHGIHAMRLDDLPRKMAPAYRQIRKEFGLGRGATATPHQTIMASPVPTLTTSSSSSSSSTPVFTPTTSSIPINPAESLLDVLSQQAQEMAALEKSKKRGSRSSLTKQMNTTLG
ncbi:hypothetical protein PWT90_10209 [Aphanocladium album]|nr:hypothetical protein PWT90_10209 [Aphanocladium album]